MKSTILTLALATVALLGFTASAEAGPGHHYGSPSHGKHYGKSHGGHGHCVQPVYKIRTIEVCRRSECRTAYNHCGRPYTYHVTVVTYRDIFSNGSSNTYTRTLS
ncbi:MAG: hypothetical protein P1U68_08100 [Verrucomicrobiales bacterium]|nr:hypothetical protein [Verrucomicrobiales bacterium]